MDRAAQERALAELDRLAEWLDDRFRVPGTDWRFGLDGLLGIVPGIGDGATAAVGGYVIARAAALGVPLHILVRMGLTLGIDLVIGTIPLVGDLFDLGFKANRRNVAHARRYFARKSRA